MNDKPKKLEFNTSHEVGTTATDEDLQSKRSRPSSRGAGSSKMIESRFDHAEDVVVRWHLGYSKRAKQQRIFECSEEEASTYLEAVDEVQNLLDQLSVQNKEEEQQPACRNPSLGSRPRQGGCKGAGQNEARESHQDSRECKKV